MTRCRLALFLCVLIPCAAAPVAGLRAQDADAANDPAKQYQQKFDQWKSIIKEMRSLRAEYTTAE